MRNERVTPALLRMITAGPAVGARGALVATLLSVVTACIGLVDYATGSGITFGPVYLVPVVAAGVFCTARLATVVAMIAAVVWSFASVLATSDGLPGVRIPVNSLLRFVILGLVVLLLAALRDALLDARRSEQRSQDFLAFAAHQLRTPTTAASAAAQTLLARGGSADDEDLLVRIAHESARAGRLVGSILQFLRIDHHRGLPRAIVDLDVVCREAMDRSRDLTEAVAVTSSAGTTTTPPVQANLDAMVEAVCCLLDNARRHARSTVHLTTGVVNGTAELIVADDGPGLPAGHETDAFLPFVSIDGQGGTGLGLAIARGLVESQHGTLTYENGAFVIRMPVGR